MKIETKKRKKWLLYLILILSVCWLSTAGSETASAFTGSIDSTPKMVQEIPKNQAKVCRDVTCSNPPPTIINFNKQEKGYPLVIDSILGISGRIWGGDLGWITFNPPFGGVRFADLSTGRLTGTAWSQTSGVINFNVTGQQVVIDPKTGEWRGWAWASGPYGGWIKFDCDDPGACVKSTWRRGSLHAVNAEGSIDTSPAVSEPTTSSASSPAPSGIAVSGNNASGQSGNAAPTNSGTAENTSVSHQAAESLPVTKPQNIVPPIPTKEMLGGNQPSILETFGQGFLTGTRYLSGEFEGYLERCADSFSGTVTGTVSFISSSTSSLAYEISSGVSNGASGIAKVLSSGISSAGNGISSGADGIASAISSTFSTIGEGVSGGTGAAAAGLSSAGSAIGDSISGGVNGIASTVSGTASSLGKVADSGANAVSGFASSLGKGVSQTALVYWSGISMGFDKIGSATEIFFNDLSSGSARLAKFARSLAGSLGSLASRF